MRAKSLKVFIKHKKIEIERISAQIFALRSELEGLQRKKTILSEEIRSLQRQHGTILFDLHLQQNYITELHEQIKGLTGQIAKIAERMEEIKKNLLEKKGQKEALEKLLERMKKAKVQKEYEKESRLADESFSRNFIGR